MRPIDGIAVIIEEYLRGNCKAFEHFLVPENQVATSCAFKTVEGRIIKAHVDSRKQTIVLLSSEEGLHPNNEVDKRRLISYMAEANDRLDYGSVIFDPESEEVLYKTGQLFLSLAGENVRPVLLFMLNKHKDCFPEIASHARTLFTNLSENPAQIAQKIHIKD